MKLTMVSRAPSRSLLKQLCTSLVCIKEVFCTYFCTFSFYILWKTGKMKSKIGAEKQSKTGREKSNLSRTNDHADILYLLSTKIVCSTTENSYTQ